MSNEKRGSWGSRSTFILAAIGSAVGLGNAWRFPGLVSKHGGATFLIVYLAAMLIMGIPLLMMEIGIGRKLRCGAPSAMRGINKKAEFIGWASTANAFVISTYYAIVFAWVLLMTAFSYKFAGLTGNTEAAGNLWTESVKTTWNPADMFSFSPAVLIAAVVAWALIWYCIRNGAHSVSKVVKFTVLCPVVLLVIMAAKGVTMPGAIDGLKKLFIPDFSQLSDPNLWVDAIGQVFYSLSIMMAIMFAYGSYLDDDSNIAVDSLIIAFSDMAISILAAIVMFSTMGGVGMLDNITSSGIATAFMVYPQAIVSLTGIGWLNAVFGVIFYLCLVTLAIDSAFSIVEGVSAAISDKFSLNPKKTTIVICIIAGIISLVYIPAGGPAWLDIVDNWTNQYNLLIVGVLECIAVGWCFKTTKLLDEINRNTVKFKMPGWWFLSTVKVIAPVLLAGLFIWNIYTLFAKSGGVYGGYPMWSNIIGGWSITILAFLSGFIIKGIVAVKKKKGFVEKEINWD